MRFVVGIDEVGRAASKRRASPNYIIGIDEVGRGALAGPVVVAAVAVPRGLRIMNYEFGKLKDSKKLTPKRREKWFDFFRAHLKIDYAVARVYPRAIEKMNISKAANLAALRAFRRLVSSIKCQVSSYDVFLDGGLFLGNNVNIRENPRKNPRLSARTTVKTVVRGDEKIKAISAASIVAKVSRDKGMCHLAKKYPQYGFEIHKGYGTKKHFAAIRKHGPSEVHRLTFLRNAIQSRK